MALRRCPISFKSLMHTIFQTSLRNNPIIKKPGWVAISVTILILLLTNAANSHARSEQEIKAVYLYNFLKFVTWPDLPSNSPFSLCVLGEDIVNDRLKNLAGQPVTGEAISIHFLNKPSSEQQCNALFIGESEKKFIKEIVQFYSKTPTLTISSVDNFIQSGGMIGFITQGNLIRFNINLKQARQTQLSISSKLLELAIEVEQ